MSCVCHELRVTSIYLCSDMSSHILTQMLTMLTHMSLGPFLCAVDTRAGVSKRRAEQPGGLL